MPKRSKQTSDVSISDSVASYEMTTSGDASVTSDFDRVDQDRMQMAEQRRLRMLQLEDEARIRRQNRD